MEICQFKKGKKYSYIPQGFFNVWVSFFFSFFLSVCLSLFPLDDRNALCCAATTALYSKSETGHRRQTPSLLFTGQQSHTLFCFSFSVDTGMHGSLLHSNPASVGETKKPPACKKVIRAVSRKAITGSGTL